MIYTLRLNIAGPPLLDGTTLLGPNDPGVVVTNPTSGVIQADIAGAFGMIDPGLFLERVAAETGTETGNTYTLATASAASAGGAYPGPATNIVERVSPTTGGQTNRETIQDLNSNPVSSPNRRLFMPCHLLAFTTTVPGPHVLSLLFKPLTDADIRGSVVEN